MLKKQKLCNVCKQIEGNPKLLQAIYDSTAYNKHSSISLRRVWEDHKQKYGEQFTYDALRNHAKKHQFLSEKDFNERHLRQIAKKAERQMLTRSIESKEVWESVINQGMEKLESGELTMKTADLLKAAKDKSDFEMKVKDQQIAMMDMVMHFASGANNESGLYDRRIVEGQTVQDYDPADSIAGNLEPGTPRPGGIHYPPAWDASAPGPDQVS